MQKKSSEYSEKELILKAQKGDVYARNQLIELNMNLVQKLAQKINKTSTLSDNDLVQEGIFGLVTAVEKFNVNLGYKFSTYAICWIKQAMYKAISEQSYSYNIPVYAQETLSRYQKIKQELEQKSQKEVSVKEVASKMNITEEKIDTFLNAFTRAMSFEANLSTNGNKETTLADIIEDEKQNVEKSVLDKELKYSINLALDNLKEKEKKVIVLRFGLEDNQKKTLEEIGNIWGVTKESIRQTEKKALAKIALFDSQKDNRLISYIR